MKQNHLALVPGELHCWYAYPDHINDPALLTVYEAMLSADEADQYHRLQQPEHKREYLVNHALLRSSLSQYAAQAPGDWQFLYNGHGKPSLLADASGLEIRFNIAHTSGLVVCAISTEADIGVDVEYHSHSQALLDMADHYFSTREVEALTAQPPSSQEQFFFRYWTLKEAYIKAVGEGLSIPSADFSFEFDANEHIRFTPPKAVLPRASMDWNFHVFTPVEDYTVALAVNSQHSTLRLFEAIPGQGYEQRSVSGEDLHHLQSLSLL